MPFAENVASQGARISSRVQLMPGLVNFDPQPKSEALQQPGTSNQDCKEQEH